MAARRITAEKESHLAEANGDPAKLFEAIKGVLYDVSKFVKNRIVRPLNLSVDFGRNDGDAVIIQNVRNDFVAVISPVGKNESAFQINVFQERHGIWSIMLFTRRKHESSNNSVAIHKRMDSGIQSASGAPDALGLSPLFHQRRAGGLCRKLSRVPKLSILPDWRLGHSPAALHRFAAIILILSNAGTYYIQFFTGRNGRAGHAKVPLLQRSKASR